MLGIASLVSCSLSKWLRTQLICNVNESYRVMESLTHREKLLVENFIDIALKKLMQTYRLLLKTLLLKDFQLTFLN